MSFGRRRCCSLLTDPLRDMLWCPCGSTSRLASAQNPLPRMYSYFGDPTLVARFVLQRTHVQILVILACANIDIPAAHRDSDTSVRVLPALSIGGAPHQVSRRTVLLGEDVRATLAAHR